MQAQSNTQLIPFAFEGLVLKESCWLDGKPYFTRRAIGEWLGYKNPDRSVHNLTQRYSHIDQFSVLIKLVSTDGKIYEQRVYDPIGLQLIINKSDKPKAIKFQVAAAHLVVAFMRGDLLPSRWCRKGDRVSAIQQLLSWPPNYSRRGVVKDIAQCEGVSIPTVYRWAEQSGQQLLTKSGKPRRTRSDKGKTIYPEYKALILAYKKAHPDKGYKKIATEMGLTHLMGCIQHWLKAA